MAKKPKQLSKWEKEVRRLSINSFKETDNALFNYYKTALKEMKVELKQYIDVYDELSFSKRLQVERQIQVANRIDEILIDLNKWSESDIRKSIENEANFGYYGTWYALESAENIQLDFAMLPEKYIEELVNKPVAGKRFSTRLYNNRTALAEQVTTSLLNGAVKGSGYAKIAKEIGELTEADYKKALRIARTEGGRVQSITKQRSYEEAKKKGVDIQKQWMATLDAKTRTPHQILDGQTVDIEEQFSFDGKKADGPRLFGDPGLDINCRCTTITVVNGITPQLRKDNETGEMTKFKNYQEWAETKGIVPKTAPTKKFDADAILSKTNLREKVGDKNYNNFVEHLNNIENERVRRLFEKYGDQVTVEKFSPENAKSVKAQATGANLTLRQDSFDGTAINNEFKTVYHEFGHAFDAIGLEKVTGKTRIATGETQKRTILRKKKTVDVYATHISGDPSYNLKENIRRDLWEYANGKGTPMLEDLGSKPRKKAEKEIWEKKRSEIYKNSIENFKLFEKNVKEKHGSKNSTVAALSDIYGGTEFTREAYPFGFGHSKSYWKDGGKLETEFFAHMTEAVASPEGHELMKEVFPNAIKSWEKMVDDMLGVD